MTSSGIICFIFVFLTVYVKFRSQYKCAVTLSFISFLLTTRESFLSTEYSLAGAVCLCISIMLPVTPG